MSPRAARGRGRLAILVACIALLGLLGGAGTAQAVTTASVAASPAGPYTAGEAITFTASSDATTAFVSYTWTVDGVEFVNDAQIVRTFSAGVHNVSVTVTELLAGSASGATSVTVLPAPPVANFTATQSPGTLKVQFSDASGGGAPSSRSWSFGDGNTSAAANPAYTYGGPGTYNVTLTVANAGGSSTVTKAVTVAPLPPGNNKPAALFTITPNPAAIGVAGATVTFDASTSSDPDGNALTYAWDLDNDGQFDDNPPAPATGITTTKVFPKAGSYVVRLRVSDGSLTDVQVDAVSVLAEAAPVAGFSVSPATPTAGVAASFSSTSTDSDGTVTGLEWDFDNDGAFDDGNGASVSWAFPVAGSQVVALRATDNLGVSSVAFKTITVAAAPAAATAPPPAPVTAQSAPKPRLLSPFPIIRIRGRIVSGASRIDVLSVRAPKGAKIRVRCRGKGCPYKNSRKTAKSSTRSTRFAKLEKRLRAGILIEVFVTKPGRIGKYTRFKIRSNAAPSRKDLCLVPNVIKPTKCPA